VSSTQLSAVDIRPLKALAKHLGTSSVLARLILSQPDFLPRREIIAKVEIFSELLELELASGVTDRRSDRD
jgi:hypothetical protein